MERLKGKLSKYTILMAAVVLFLIITVLLGTKSNQSVEEKLAKQLELGQKYLQEMNYEEAIVAFNKVIEIDPKNVEAYLGLADAYIGQNDLKNAIAILEAGFKVTSDKRLKENLDALSSSDKKTETNTEYDAEETHEEIVETTGESDSVQDKWCSLLEDGMTDHMATGKDVTFCGYEVSRWKLEEAMDMVIESGAYIGDSYGYDYENNNVWCIGTYIENDWSQVSVLQVPKNEGGYCHYWSYSARDEGGLSVGIRDIRLLDSFSKVMTELGFANGEEIEKFMREMVINSISDEVRIDPEYFTLPNSEERIWVEITIYGEQMVDVEFQMKDYFWTFQFGDWNGEHVLQLCDCTIYASWIDES